MPVGLLPTTAQSAAFANGHVLFLSPSITTSATPKLRLGEFGQQKYSYTKVLSELSFTRLSASLLHGACLVTVPSPPTACFHERKQHTPHLHHLPSDATANPLAHLPCHMMQMRPPTRNIEVHQPLSAICSQPFQPPICGIHQLDFSCPSPAPRMLGTPAIKSALRTTLIHILVAPPSRLCTLPPPLPPYDINPQQCSSSSNAQDVG